MPQSLCLLLHFFYLFFLNYYTVNTFVEYNRSKIGMVRQCHTSNVYGNEWYSVKLIVLFTIFQRMFDVLNAI